MKNRLAVLQAGLLVTCLGLGGCATAPSSFYTLSAIPPALERAGAPPSTDLAIGIGPIRFPEFLDRPQIVSRTGPNRLALDEFHRWGGSLQDDFARVLGENIGGLLGTSRILVEPTEARFPLDFRVVADVLRFEGVPGGEVVFKVRWAVLGPYLETALAVGEETYRKRARSAETRAMIAALSEALLDFSRDLARQLRNLPKTEPREAYAALP